MGGRGRKAGQAAAATDILPGLVPGSERNGTDSKPKKRGKKAGTTPTTHLSWRRRAIYFAGRWFGAGIESAALAVLGLVAIVVALSRMAERFTGDSLLENLFPFAATVLGLCVVSFLFMQMWFAWRRFITRLGAVGRRIPSVVAVCLAGGAVLSWVNESARYDIRQLQGLVGGSAETERAAIAHQVFAHYRRSNLDQTSRMISRGMAYDATVREAAAAFGVSHEILMGIAATESSFLPRPSNDGGHGLFQVTKPPRAALDAAKTWLGVDTLDVETNHRHNIFVGAATFQHYQEEMNDDLFLALLAYNIGPHNGGLRSIMRNYGATNYVRIQPYLKDLPRDYPIRVLSAALAYRLWTTNFGTLSRYEEGSNATVIQEIGVPGLERAGGLSDLVAGAH